MLQSDYLESTSDCLIQTQREIQLERKLNPPSEVALDLHLRYVNYSELLFFFLSFKNPTRTFFFFFGKQCIVYEFDSQFLRLAVNLTLRFSGLPQVSDFGTSWLSFNFGCFFLTLPT